MTRGSYLKVAAFVIQVGWSGILCLAGPEQGASSIQRPNILLVIADDWSYGHAGAYGCSWVKTPNFDRLAKEGVLFTRAFTPNAKCAPSRATILTGRYSWQLDEAANHWSFFPPKFGSYVERLKADGYYAGFTGKGWAPGNAGKRELTGKRYSQRKAKPLTKGISPIDYAANFEDFIHEVPKGQPWVFWCGTLEPHRSYEFKSGVRLGKKLSDIDRVPGYWPDNVIARHDMLDYAIEVEHVDNHLGRIVELLGNRKQLENTLIVVTSDHGMPFPRVKGQAYDHSNHVPLAIRWPGGIANPGRVSHDFINFTDLAPTFLDVAGIANAAPVMQPMSGFSLTGIFSASNDRSSRSHTLVGKERHDIGRPDDVGYPIRGIRRGHWLYLRNFEVDRWPAGNPETGYLNCDGGAIKSDILEQRRSGESTVYWDLCFGKRPPEELYNLSDDPDCLKNLADSPEQAQMKEKLRGMMEAELKEQGDPRMFGNGGIFDAYPNASPSTKNFYSRYMQGEKMKAGWVKPSDFEKEPLDQ